MTNRTLTALQDERYLLLSRLGRGGMGSVYRAFDRVRQTVVALKVLTDNRRRGPAHPLAREFDAWTRLEHENVVRAYEMSVSRTGPFPAETPYLVLEHSDGLPAHHALEPGRTAPAVLERLAVAVLHGLAHVHAAGLVHRDLKPSNVLVNRRGDGELDVKITDFGLAAATGVTERPGTISGSLPFVSPESLVGLPLDGRADLYGLGILLYHIAAGAMPAAGGTVDDLVRWHLDGPPADPRRVRPRCPVRLARFVRRLTARAREERPESAVAALGLLDCETRGVPGVGAPPTGLAELAELRLALDAARLGGRRLYRLPDCPVRAAALVREVRVWSQVRGLAYCDVGDDASRTGHPDGSAILRLLLELGPEAESIALRHDLQRWAPVRLLGGVPLEDRSAAPLRPARTAGLAARCGKPGFLRAFVRRRTLIVRLGGRRLAGWIGRELSDALRASNGPRPAPGAGGLLVVLDPSRPSRFNPATGPDSSGRG